jgi:GT2 family glycosyltransferase
MKGVEENFQRVIAVVVTYNRLTLLKKAIEALHNQTRSVDEILVINNESTDGTKEWLDAHEGLRVIHQKNLGGAGGFHTGMCAAYNAGADWVWCMDDDSICEVDALEKLLSSSVANDPETGFLSSKVLWTDGSMHAQNSPAMLDCQLWLNDFSLTHAIRLKVASFVSFLVHKRAIEKCGLPHMEYFIWLDDVEYATRVSNHFKCYLIVNSIVLHETPTNHGWNISELNDKNAWKYRCLFRNTFPTMQTSGQYGIKFYIAGLFKLWTYITVSFNKCSFQQALSLTKSSVYGYLFFRPKATKVEKNK